MGFAGCNQKGHLKQSVINPSIVELHTTLLSLSLSADIVCPIQIRAQAYRDEVVCSSLIVLVRMLSIRVIQYHLHSSVTKHDICLSISSAGQNYEHTRHRILGLIPRTFLAAPQSTLRGVLRQVPGRWRATPSKLIDHHNMPNQPKKTRLGLSKYTPLVRDVLFQRDDVIAMSEYRRIGSQRSCGRRYIHGSTWEWLSLGLV